MARNGEAKTVYLLLSLAITETYTVGIDMEKALANPGSQDAVNTAKEFNERLDFNGCCTNEIRW